MPCMLSAFWFKKNPVKQKKANIQTQHRQKGFCCCCCCSYLRPRTKLLPKNKSRRVGLLWLIAFLWLTSLCRKNIQLSVCWRDINHLTFSPPFSHNFLFELHQMNAQSWVLKKNKHVYWHVAAALTTIYVLFCFLTKTMLIWIYYSNSRSGKKRFFPTEGCFDCYIMKNKLRVLYCFSKKLK